MRKVAVVGGGMAGLTAAWQLSGPKCRNEIEVTVYQRGWRLGGKGASSRGLHGRIEEHGLHVWLGYYENAFRLMRRAYRELDRSTNDPTCPVLRIEQAFAPVSDVGVGDVGGGAWSDWLAGFSRIGGDPGAGAQEPGESSAARFIRRSLALLIDFAASLPDETDFLSNGPVVLSLDPPRELL